ncbi:MAG: hypothetical protein V1848_02890 [Candidatus Magasanikbacteria bacterium]
MYENTYPNTNNTPADDTNLNPHTENETPLFFDEPDIDDFFDKKSEETEFITEEKKEEPRQTETPLIETQKEETTLQTKQQLAKMIYGMKDQLDAMLRLLEHPDTHISSSLSSLQSSEIEETIDGEKILEGVFDGEHMIGQDGKEYTVPPNYASKSKLVEGDIMKLTITKKGSFIYKQIKPIERKRLIGELVSDNVSGHWIGVADGKPFKLITASVTFYKGKPGDEVVLLVPENGESQWAAVENIVHK